MATAVLTLAAALARAPIPVADTIIARGRIYTGNSQQPWAEAVAIRAGKIIAVGDESAVFKLRYAGTEVIEAGGHLILPGFVDCHIHFLDGSLSLGRVNLEGAKDASDIQQRLRDYVAKHPGKDWILGRGWNYAMFGPEALPHKEYLDEDEATGALKESAQELVARVVPRPSRNEKLAALRAGIKWANEHGLTRVHSAGGDFEQLDLYDELRRQGQQTLRFYIAYFLNPPKPRPQDLDAIEASRKKFHDEWIDTNAVKMMVDGVVESHTAAMLEPYSDDPSVKGKLFWDPVNYTAAVAELDKRGLQLFTHAIGDYGVRTTLDAYAHAEEVNHTSDRRPRIEHIETITAADIPRFGKLGVIASMQPLHSYPDADTLEVWARNAGPDRASRAWAWKSISNDGGHLAFGSDWPVVTLNPWEGVQTAVTRQTAEGKPDAGFVPEQRLTVEETVRGYTLGAAYAGRREKTEGSIEPGKLADLIIVSQNIFEIDAQRLAETKVLTTIVGGRVVYHGNAEPARLGRLCGPFFSPTVRTIASLQSSCRVHGLERRARRQTPRRQRLQLRRHFALQRRRDLDRPCRTRRAARSLQDPYLQPALREAS